MAVAQDIYLKGYADDREAKAGVASWIAFYNDRRLHQALGYRTPMAVWRKRMQAAKAVDMVDNANALTTMPTATAADRVSGSVIERDQEQSVSN